MKKFYIPIILVVVFLAGAGIGQIILTEKLTDNQPAETVSLNFASHKVPLAAPYIIAKEKSFFNDHGLDIEMTYFNTGLETIHALSSNQADFASSGTTPYVHFSFQRNDVKIINQVTLANDIQLLARKDTINSLTDFKGKKIAFIKGTVTKLAIINTLKEAGLTENDYELIMFNQPIALPAALSSHEIDAFSAWEPIISNGIKAVGSDNALVFGAENGLHSLPYLSMVRENYLVDENQDIIDNFNLALIDSVNFMENNRDESIKIIAEVVKMDESVVSNIWDKYEFDISLKKDLIEEFNYEKNWFAPEDPKVNPVYENLIDTSSLKRLLPENVEL
jgi:NitT/TauT family transport system substrate-binding protein